MNYIKSKIFKDWSLSYFISMLVLPIVAIILNIILTAKTSIRISPPYDFIIYSIPPAFLICSLVLGALSIQYIRIMMLSGITRTKAFKRVLSLNLMAVVPSVVIYLIALLLPFHTLSKMQMMIYFLGCIITGLGFGFYASAITTICNVYVSIIVIALSAIFVFVLPSIGIKNLELIVITISLISCMLLFISYFIYKSKQSRIKSTTIN